ncbi:monovalent cation/H(+) antiporter subunit G [Nocardioides sp. CFH 31398]|uniref:monovalent cation/H(+) antiporter subunit G n=1 Tax=Nocardioides sp. CFH 31398 TaxID=2919579 RepID=UPI001F06BCBA|nr:monovalent cation/H(+) antiporter subunit G [Nocardioides sp. CFH 31398]MCH1864945.1 monovalent cation/H(+) antiporter subunit G [Nocardioides sp. CFH 31398]
MSTSTLDALTAVADVASGVLILLGALLSLVAAIGMLRFPDVLTRMHSATKPQVLGVVLVVLGLALNLRDASVLMLLLLVVVFQMSTSPVAGHMVGRAAFRAGQVRDDLLVVDELSDTLGGDGEPRGAP